MGKPASIDIKSDLFYTIKINSFNTGFALSLFPVIDPTLSCYQFHSSPLSIPLSLLLILHSLLLLFTLFSPVIALYSFWYQFYPSLSLLSLSFCYCFFSSLTLFISLHYRSPSLFCYCFPFLPCYCFLLSPLLSLSTPYYRSLFPHYHSSLFSLLIFSLLLISHYRFLLYQ
jgi:hypothetical protein